MQIAGKLTSMKLDWLERLVYNKEPKFSEWDKFHACKYCKKEVSEGDRYKSYGVCPHCGTKATYYLIETTVVAFRKVRVLWHEFFEGKRQKDNEALEINGYEVYKPQSQELVQ